jgi:hypothetical protein
VHRLALAADLSSSQDSQDSQVRPVSVGWQVTRE